MAKHCSTLVVTSSKNAKMYGVRFYTVICHSEGGNKCPCETANCPLISPSAVPNVPVFSLSATLSSPLRAKKWKRQLFHFNPTLKKKKSVSDAVWVSNDDGNPSDSFYYTIVAAEICWLIPSVTAATVMKKQDLKYLFIFALHFQGINA